MDPAVKNPVSLEEEIYANLIIPLTHSSCIISRIVIRNNFALHKESWDIQHKRDNASSYHLFGFDKRIDDDRLCICNTGKLCVEYKLIWKMMISTAFVIMALSCMKCNHLHRLMQSLSSVISNCFEGFCKDFCYSLKYLLPRHLCPLYTSGFILIFPAIHS